MDRHHLLQLYASFLISIGSFLFGIILAWSATAIPKLNENSQLNLSTFEVALTESSMFLGGAISCTIAGIVRNRFGTTSMISIYSVPGIIGWGLLVLEINFWLIILARFLCGITGGGFVFIVSIYIGEIASKEIRGRLASLTEITAKLGFIFVNVLGSFAPLWMMNFICGSIALFYLIACNFLPETPVFLVQKREIEEARKVLEIFRKSYQKIEEELNELQSMEMESENTFFIEIKDKASRRAFMIIIGLFMLFQTCDVNSIMTRILIDSRMNFNPSTIGIFQVIGAIFAAVFVDRKGRKFLLHMSFVAMAFGLLINGIFFHLQSHKIQYQGLEWFPFVGMIIALTGFTSGLGTITFVLMSEIFSTSAKKVVAPLALAGNFFLSFVIFFAFPLISANVEMYMMFYFFTLSCFAGIIFTWKFIPETKGKSLSEIQILLNKI